MTSSNETFSDETLMAYVDGEVDATQRAAIEQTLPLDPQLAERIAQQRRLRTRLAAAFGGVLEEPVPARLSERALTAPSGDATSGGEVLAGSPRWFGAARQRTQRWSWPEWSALAAALLVGVLLDRVWPSAPGAPLASVAGQVLARGELAANLSQARGGSTDPRSKIEVGMSYLAKSGKYCRTFSLPGAKPAAASMAGIACRDGADWRVQALLQTAGDANPEYRQAGSALPAALVEVIETDSAAEPLDAEAEAAVRARGWRR